MERKSFLKSLFGLAAAPSILADVEFESSNVLLPSVKPFSHFENKGLVSDLNLMMPTYYKSMMEKYGNDNYSLFVDVIQK